MKVYRAQYWTLLEEMRSKYRRFYLRNGRGGWREGPEGDGSQQLLMPPAAAAAAAAATALPLRGAAARSEPHAPDKPANVTLHCAAPGPCLAKPLALSVFCLAHVLLEPRQKLYKPCMFPAAAARGGAGGGGGGASATCGRPVLSAVVPQMCQEHQEKAQKQAARAAKRATMAPPPQAAGGHSKAAAPKLHLIISEYGSAALFWLQQHLRASCGTCPARWSSSHSSHPYYSCVPRQQHWGAAGLAVCSGAHR
eukprot:jgi/Mesen1/7579/ME000392S06840